MRSYVDDTVPCLSVVSCTGRHSPVLGLRARLFRLAAPRARLTAIGEVNVAHARKVWSAAFFGE